MKKGLFLIGIIIVFLLIGACGKSNQKNMDLEIEMNKENENIISNDIVDQTDWISSLKIANETNQILVVAADSDNAKISLHNKNENGIWNEIISADASIGKNGVGKEKEGDGKTPSGVYHFMFGFGIKGNPGTDFTYIQVDNSYYWVDDSQSKYYNKFVSTKNVLKDWDSAEHIVSAERSYHYVLALDYNIECVPGKGSAIFMHCTPSSGAGCIAVSEDVMVEVMKKIENDCIIIIDEEENLNSY